MSLTAIPILDVWRRAGGGMVRRDGRARAFWRDGDGWSVSIDQAGNVWYDFAAGGGGGVLALLQVILRTDRRGALRWLEREGLLAPRETTAEDRARYAHLRELARGRTADYPFWRRGAAWRAERAKATAAWRSDWNRLALFAPLVYRLTQGKPADVLPLYHDHLKRFPQRAASLIAWGRADVADAHAVAWACASMLWPEVAR